MTKEQPQQALDGRRVRWALIDGIGISFRSRWISSLVCLAMAGWAPRGLCVDDSDSFYPERSIAPLPAGALGLPFGEPVVVEGQVISGPFKLESSSTEGRLLVRRINGVATQQGLVIRFNPVTTREWWRDLKHQEREELWKIKQAKLKTMMGRFYEMRGYEYGYHVGMTQEEFALQNPVQSGGFVFRVGYRPLMMKEVPATPFTPADFEGRAAELIGSAVNREGKGWLVNADGWALLVRDSAWSADFERREVMARGIVSGSRKTGWRMDGADLRLLHLRDQLGKEVKLDGVAWSTNGFWWFEFRGEKLYVENQKDLPGWTGAMHGRLITILGKLDRDRLPDLEQISLKVDRDLREYYVVRCGSWAPLDQSWKKPLVIPAAPKLTPEYLKSCGIDLTERSPEENLFEAASE